MELEMCYIYKLLVMESLDYMSNLSEIRCNLLLGSISMFIESVVHCYFTRNWDNCIGCALFAILLTSSLKDLVLVEVSILYS